MKIKNQILKLMLTVVLALSIFSCDNEGNNDEIVKLPTINEIVNADLDNYSVLRKGLEVSNLLSTITGNGAYTVFAPSNASFAAYKSSNFPAGITEAIITSTTPALTQLQKDELKRLMMYHVLSGATFASDLPSKNYIKTIAPYGTTSATLSAYVDKTNGIEINGGDLMVGTPAVSNGGAKVTKGDIKASNGVIHKINAVLALPTLINQLNANPDLSSYLTNLSADDASSLSLVVNSLPNSVQLPIQLTIVLPALNISNTQLFVPTKKAFEDAATYLTGKTPAQISSIIKFHITTVCRYNRNANVGIQTSQNQNDGASNATSYLPSTAITDATVSTKLLALVQPAPPISPVFQSFKIAKNTLNAFEDPILTGISVSKIKTTNIHTTNGIIHTIDRVLQPAL